MGTIRRGGSPKKNSSTYTERARKIERKINNYPAMADTFCCRRVPLGESLKLNRDLKLPAKALFDNSLKC